MLTRRSCALAGLLSAVPLAHARTTGQPLRAVGSQFARIFEGADRQLPKGLAVELLRQLFGTSNVRFEWLPWSRAQLMLEQGEADILIGPYRTPEREARMLFSVRPFYADAMAWYARRGEETRWRGEFAAVASSPVAAVRGWAYGSRFERLRPGMSELNWVKDVETGLQMLTKRRVDLFAANDRNCLPVLQRLNLVNDVTRCAPPMDILHGHMAFARSAAGERLAQQHDQVFEGWLRTSAATELYRRWGVEKLLTAT
jgi:polar amino acid transport system substrate-binding protein